MVAPVRSKTTRRAAKMAVIDCDIHNALPAIDALSPFLPDRWRRHHQTFGYRGYNGINYPPVNPHAAARTDAVPPSGLPPGSDLQFMREQLLDSWELEYGVLNPLVLLGSEFNIEYSAAIASAVNYWQIAEWLEPEPRLRASLVVPSEDGELAADEINRLGDHPGFVQVLMLARLLEPIGRRKYWKIFEAAVDHDLPIGVHFSGLNGDPLTGAGWPSYYIEYHAGMTAVFQSVVTSLVYEGVFERFPTLKVVLVEGGFGWLPPLMWRLDRSWQVLGDEVPHVRRAPSEYIRDHFWISTQPMEEPATPEQFQQLLGQLNMDDRLMFATDYPHWDFDAPDQALPQSIPPDLRRQILADNARALYRL